MRECVVVLVVKGWGTTKGLKEVDDESKWRTHCRPFYSGVFFKILFSPRERVGK